MSRIIPITIPGVFPGWNMVGVTVANQMVQAGLFIYCFSIVAAELEAEFDTTRLGVMATASILSVMTNLLSPFFCPLIDRKPMRSLMLLGGAMAFVGLWLLSFTAALWQAWLVFALILPVSNLMLGQITSTALLARWFVRMRGRAIGISSIGTSLGGLLLAPIFIGLIGEYGWRTAVQVIGTGVLVVLTPLAYFLVSNRPSDLGEYPDGDSASEEVSSPVSISFRDFAVSAKRILRLPAFWLMTMVIGLMLAGYLGIIDNL